MGCLAAPLPATLLRACVTRGRSFKPDAVSLAPLIDRLGHGARPWPLPLPRPLIVVLGREASRRNAAAAGVLAALQLAHPESQVALTPPPEQWPFLHPLVDVGSWPDGQVVLWAPELHDAFVNLQGNSTHLVTTQALFLLQLWADAVSARADVTLVATADTATLEAHAAEALDGRGAWRDVTFVDASTESSSRHASGPPVVEGPWAVEQAPPHTSLPASFRSSQPADRLAAAGRALDETRSVARLLVMASACMEVNNLDNAGDLLAEAARLAPDWAAVHFEYGKYWLRRDDIVTACEAFGRASGLMPTFASAAANWGATLGELDRPDQALAAFTRALTSDPGNAQAVNNVGVVTRELGRLGESEAAFRRVIALTPDLAFGHYNLGHTLFLQGRYQASLSAYVAGQRKDPERNPVQASRLALARLATGDASGALRDLQACTASLQGDYRRQLLSDTHAVAWALLSAAPDLRDWRVVGDWLTAEVAAS